MQWAIIVPLVVYLGVLVVIGVWSYHRRREVKADFEANNQPQHNVTAFGEEGFPEGIK